LILARDTGAIIRATGAITRPTSPDHPLAAEYASAVYRYVKASEELVGALENIDGGVMGGVAREKTDGEEDNGERDDMRLLRIRTRRRELVVVPGGSYPSIIYKGECGVANK
jgi:dynein light chain roadblock-type